MRVLVLKFVAMLFLLQAFCTQAAFAGGRTYQGKESSAHCTLWSTDRLRWPQTILGKLTAKCRIRAKRLSKGPVVCRLKRDYIDSETDERMCIYQRGGFNLGDATVSMPKTEKCLKTYSCKRE